MLPSHSPLDHPSLDDDDDGGVIISMNVMHSVQNYGGNTVM